MRGSHRCTLALRVRYLRMVSMAWMLPRAVALVLTIGTAASVVVSHDVAAATYLAQIDVPRAFGYTIGDVATERVLLAAAGHDVRDVAPPSSGRIDLWLERRPGRVETDAQGRRWLVIDYQITNAPRVLTQIALPALSLRAGNGEVLQVGAWPIGVGPIVPDTTVAPADAISTEARTPPAGAAGPENGLAVAAGASMQPDRGAQPIELAPIARRFGYALACLVATLAGWMGWWLWRNRRDAAQLPFARGWRQMRSLSASGAFVHADAPWHIVHRALDETAGQVVHRHSLSRLFARAPWLAPMQPQLEHFYEHSAARFFAVSSQAADRSAPDGPSQQGPDATVVALLRVLFLAERERHR